MAHRIPHTFDELVGTRSARDLPILFCGSGMSWPLVPTPRELIELLQQRKSEIEATLGVTWAPLLNTEPNTLYQWANEVYESLQATGLSPRAAKLKIAQVLCVTTDPCWTAKASVPLRGNTPRHRPVWLRVCFNSGRQKFFAGLPMDVEAIPTHRRDEHIPWNDQSTERLDLMAAKLLLLALHRHSNTGACQWDFGMFPGALWDRSSHHLVVPVPSWAQTEMQSLSALKPLVESRHWAYQGAISKVSLLGLDAKSDSASIARDVQMNWKYELSRLMHFSNFASPANISWLTLREWEASL